MDPCGATFSDHTWNRYYSRDLLVRVECDNCGITPDQWLSQQRIVENSPFYLRRIGRELSQTAVLLFMIHRPWTLAVMGGVSIGLIVGLTILGWYEVTLR